jgi:hypothetical protein
MAPAGGRDAACGSSRRGARRRRSGVHVEVAVAVALAVVAPQVQRHRRHRRRAHQLAHGVDQRPARASSIRPATLAPRQRTCISPRTTGSVRRPPTKAPAKSVPPLMGRSRCAGRPRAAGAPRSSRSTRRTAASRWSRWRAGATGRPRASARHAGLQAVGVEGRAGAEEGGAAAAAKRHSTPRSGARWLGFTPGCRRRRSMVVPPSSAADLAAFHMIQPVELYQWKRSPVSTVAGPRSLCSAIFSMFEHDAAMAVHDGLGQAGGAAGIDDPQRVVEGQPVGREAGRRVACSSASKPVRRVRGGEFAFVGGRVQVGQQHQVAHAGQAGQHLAQHGAAVVRAAAVELAVDGDQHHRRDLAEAVEHRHRPHVGASRATTPRPATPGQEGHHGLRRVGQVGAHAVAGLHALLAQPQWRAPPPGAQLGPADDRPPARPCARSGTRWPGGRRRAAASAWRSTWRAHS